MGTFKTDSKAVTNAIELPRKGISEKSISRELTDETREKLEKCFDAREMKK